MEDQNELSEFLNDLADIVNDKVLSRNQPRRVRIKSSDKFMNIDVSEIVESTPAEMIDWHKGFYQTNEDTAYKNWHTYQLFRERASKLKPQDLLVLEVRTAQVVAIYKAHNERAFTNEFGGKVLGHLLGKSISGKAYEKRVKNLEDNKLNMKVESLIKYRIIV